MMATLHQEVFVIKFAQLVLNLHLYLLVHV